MRRGLACVTAALHVLLCVRVAGADEKHRRVAVLEYRAGANGASELGSRLALILRTKTSIDVVDPDDARRLLGNKVDDELAKCGGEPRCVAQIGARLDAREVILVGVSELGDLIVALQRIDVKSHAVAARIAESLAPDAEPDDAALEGYLRRLMPRADFLRFGTIRIATDLKGATVTVDKKSHGKTPLGPIQVEAPAKYEVRLSKHGYADFTVRVDVPPDGTIEVRPTIQRLRGASWYDHWYVWAIAGSVIIGGVIGGIALAQPSPTSVPITVTPMP
jgi:hypothetical protein